MSSTDKAPGEQQYPHVFSSLEIGNITVRNRIMQTAHEKVFSIAEDIPNQREVYYQRERARGGLGLMITGNRLIHPLSNAGMRGNARGYREDILEREKEITRVVHEHGGRIIAQQNHFGVNGESDAMDDYRYLQGPSPVESPAFNEKPKPMDEQDMDELAEFWARCCEISRDANFDGVEVHLAHSYLLHEFLSPLFNKRDDEYGGSLENRLRFPLKVIERVRDRVGDDYVVGIRVCVDDLVEGGLTPDETAQIAASIEETGMIDYVNTTVATYHGIGSAIPPSDIEEGWTRDKVATVKDRVDLPVFLVGGVKDPDLAEDVLASGDADMIAMTRAQIAEPEFVNKLREGRQDEITHCIRCNEGCIGRLFEGKPITCILNPGTGREERFGVDTLEPAENPRKWVVVGGGPAGMKSAQILSKRGHDVTLYEKEDQLGGQVNYILKTPRRETFEWVIKDLSNALDRQGVDVKLGQAADQDTLSSLDPHGVVLATGSQPMRSGFSSVNPMADEIPGVRQDNVFTALEALDNPEQMGDRTLILDDTGDRYSSGTAEVLMDHGTEVHLVTRFQSLFPELVPTLDQSFVYSNTMEKGMDYTVNHWVAEIDGHQATLFNLYTEETQVLEGFDSFVLAVGHESNDDLYDTLSGSYEEIHRVGDALAPRRIGHAIYEGELIGRELFDAEEKYIEGGSLETPFKTGISG